MDFEQKKEFLLKEAYDFETYENFTADYKKRFFDFIEEVILFLLESEDSFFGQFMLKVKRNIRVDITVPIATIPKINGFNMYFNPFLFLYCTKKEMAALIKHEIYHIMNSHYERERNLKNKVSKEAAGIALDISINQYIKDMPLYSMKLERVNREYNLNLLENKSAEEYADEIYKSIKLRISNDKVQKDSVHQVDIRKAHDMWDEIELDEEDIRSLTKKTAISSYNKDAPEGIKGIISGYNEKAEIPWQIVLKNMIPSVKCGYKKTITRRNRRQPERLDLRGRLPRKEIDIIAAIDISASMSDEDMHKILVEILNITSSFRNKVTVIECDNEVRSVYSIKKESDIRKRCKNNGSTEFSPVFKYINENNMKDSIVIYFTDGVGEDYLKVKPMNKKVIWVVCGEEKLSLKKPYGQIKRIHTAKKEKIEGNIGLKMVNAVIHDWAR